MLGLSFASVPLYDLFCRVTGYAGTVQRASLAPGSNGQYRNIQIRFDSNISQELNWEFKAPKKEIIVQPGIQQVIYYTAKNLSNKPTMAQTAHKETDREHGLYYIIFQVGMLALTLVRRMRD